MVPGGSCDVGMTVKYFFKGGGGGGGGGGAKNHPICVFLIVVR